MLKILLSLLKRTKCTTSVSMLSPVVNFRMTNDDDIQNAVVVSVNNSGKYMLVDNIN